MKYKEILERAHQIRALKLDECTSAEQAKDIIMKEVYAGKAQQLGDGCFSCVYAGTVSQNKAVRLVVKISDRSGDGWLEYGKYAKANWKSNPFLPKVAKIVEFDSSSFMAFINFLTVGDENLLEKALKINETGFLNGSIYRDLYSFLFMLRQAIDNKYGRGEFKPPDEGWSFFEAWENAFEPNHKFKEVLTQIGKLSKKGARIDVHMMNWGIDRNNRLVFLDPLSFS